MSKVKRAFICAPLMPEFDKEGGSKRTFHLIKTLREEGWAVTFLAQNSVAGTEYYARILRQMGVEVYAGNHSKWAGDEFIFDADNFIAVSGFDLAILTFWYMGERYLETFRDLCPRTKIIIDTIDLQFLRSGRNIYNKARQVGKRNALDADYADAMRRELNAYESADLVLAVSQKEADLINDLTGNPALAHSVPLMEDLDLSDIPFEERNGILFIGNFRHPPNLEAVEFLCKKIIPKVNPELLKKHPLFVVGNELSQQVFEIGRDLSNTKMVGWVPSLVPYLQNVRLTVVPLLNGAGTKTKLIQALTVGTPTVSTSIGAEGLELHDGKELLIADDATAFARRIEILLTDKAVWEGLSRQGREHISSRHGSQVVAASFIKAVNAALLTPLKSKHLNAETL